jgi:hypothetical protein
VGSGCGGLDRGALLLTESARYPFIADAVTGSLISVEYSADPFGAGGQPKGVKITSDPSGQYLLLTYGGPGGFFTGWIHHSELRFLPITQPYVEFPIPAW